MKKIGLILVATCLLVSCNSKKSEDVAQPAPTNASVVKNDSLGVANVYEGVLPCADCSGIETTLKIYAGDGTMETHKFELTSVYKGKEPENKFTQTGNYNFERGIGEDPDGTIYVLNWDKPETDHIYYGYNSTKPEKLYLLDNKREIIESELNYSLTLKK